MEVKSAISNTVSRAAESDYWIRDAVYNPEKYDIIYKENVLSATNQQAANNLIGSTSGSRQRLLGSTVSVPADLQSAIQSDIETSLGTKIKIHSCSVKTWSFPSRIHSDGSDYDYSVIIPIKLRIKPAYMSSGWGSDTSTKGEEKDKFGLPVGNSGKTNQLYANGLSVAVGGPGSGYNANGHWVSAANSSPEVGPGLVIFEQRYGNNVVFLPAALANGRANTAGGMVIKTDLTGVTEQDTRSKSTNFNAVLGPPNWDKHSNAMKQGLSIKEVMPWYIGNMIMFRPDFLHCSTKFEPVVAWKSHLLLGIDIVS